MNTPDRGTAAAFPRYLAGEVLADSVALQWPGLYARRCRFPRVVDRFLVPATPEPHITCNLRGTAAFREREVKQGIGAPVVAIERSTEGHARDGFLMPRLYYGVTALSPPTHCSGGGSLLLISDEV